MELRPGYKQTEVGVIPEEWDCEPMRDAAANIANAIVGGPFGSDLVSADYVTTGVPVIRGQNMSANLVSGDFVFVSPRKAKSLSANLAYPGDLVFTQRGTLGQVSIVPGNEFDCFLISQSQMKVSLNRTRHDPSFVHQYFTSREGLKQVTSSAIQTGVPHTNLGILRQYRFPAPPLPEQRAIAAALSDVDALLGGLERLIAKKRDLKQAAMQQLLTGHTRLPGFHREWEVSTVGREFEIQLGKMLDAEKNVGVPKPFIGNRAVQWGSIEVGDLPTVPMSRSDIDRFRLKRGDLLVCEGGEVGRAAIWEAPIEECYYQKALHRLRPMRGFHPRLMAALLRLWSDRGLFSNYVTQTSIAHLPREKFLEMPLLVPSTAEQTAIATVLSDMDAELSALEARRDKTRALKQGMMQELLTGRIRLVVASSNVVPVDFASIQKHAPSYPKSHNWQFNEAVVVAMLVKQFGSEQYPLGRKRRTKLGYLMHRHVERAAQGYLKKAAGPYNPAIKYKGPETIAQKNGYIRPHTSGKFSGFVAAGKIAEAEGYFDKWYGREVLAWLEQFRHQTNDELELLATVDMAIVDVKRVQAEADVAAVKCIILDHPEWETKLEREIFSDANIARAIGRVTELFAE